MCRFIWIHGRRYGPRLEYMFYWTQQYTEVSNTKARKLCRIVKNFQLMYIHSCKVMCELTCIFILDLLTRKEISMPLRLSSLLAMMVLWSPCWIVLLTRTRYLSTQSRNYLFILKIKGVMEMSSCLHLSSTSTTFSIYHWGDKICFKAQVKQMQQMWLLSTIITFITDNF